MRIKINSEMIAGGAFTIVSMVLLKLIPTQIDTYEKTSINAQTFPKIALGGLFIFSLVLLIQGIFFLPKKEILFNDELYSSRVFKDSIRSLIYIAILIIYMLIFKKVGFIISNILLTISILAYYRTKKWSYYAIALGIGALVYLLFTLVLHISLP